MYQPIKFRYAFILIALFLLIGCVAKREITTVKKPMETFALISFKVPK